ncbi:MAG: hypothetical protein A2669_01840 [Candidatus Yanofskybacteria bacterium RIFCSPHIGHO2_01_FULL_48_25b]|uniref:HTH cro/C1-type domain-containing protein n=1 Tax=Candidatus Yanofskybacteria bacterium RIFCSPHIGHO2_01_FULL_48_25b TaxID=1802672 RepID=A0A1F8F5A6_9BACT|nr:MAG: hypothetical protein A2669_01840 [Candidatus Yanofskybacteria bacterium RIFCSPHIGHO2_01_FULL_48_25b]
MSKLSDYISDWRRHYAVLRRSLPHERIMERLPELNKSLGTLLAEDFDSKIEAPKKISKSPGPKAKESEESFGRWLANARFQKDMQLKPFAERVGITPQELGKIELGLIQPSRLLLDDFERVLGTKIPQRFRDTQA